MVEARKVITKIVENWPAKVLSLALAIVLFVFHRMNTLETRFFSTPIVLENLSIVTPSSPYPRMIRVSLRGEANNLHTILEDDIETYIDMKDFSTPGTYKVPVKWRKKGNSLMVEPLQISVDPMEITISLDEKISKFVSLAASFIGQVDAGFNMTSYSFNPNQMIVEGPVSLLGSISELQIEPIDLTGRKNDFSIIATVLHQDPLIVIRGEGTTEISGTISQIIPVRNIMNVAISITGLHEGFTGELEVKTANIHMEGDNRDAVERFDPPDGFLKVDCSGISESGTYMLRIITGAADGVTLRTDPQEVKVQIEFTGE